MKIRRATEADEPALRALWERFEAEVPAPPSHQETWDEEWADVRADIADGSVQVAEDDEGPLGYARATAPEKGRSHLHAVYVDEPARRRGITKALLRAIVDDLRGRAEWVSLNVQTSNERARTVWRRLGFEDVSQFMMQPLDRLDRRLADEGPGETRGAIYAQTDDRVSIDRALTNFRPRLEGLAVGSTDNGWIKIADPVLDAERTAQSRLARELSERLGAVVVALALEEGAVVRFQLFERGRMVDEYLSVPSYYGELPKGDELALDANPTLVARLTGADREAVRAVARTATSPADLPPAEELYGELARMMGLEP